MTRSTTPDLTPSLDAYRGTLLGQSDARFLSNRYAKPAVIIIAITMLLVPAVQSCRKIGKVQKSLYRESGERQGTALGRWLPTAGVLFQEPSTDPYGEGHWFPTPPPVLICLAPLSNLSFTAAAIVWAALKIGGLALVAWLLLREVGIPMGGLPLGVEAMALAFGARPIVSDLQHANLNIFMAIWTGLCLVYYLRNRDGIAGVFLALAIVTKITPALLLIYFAYKRSWRICISCGASLLVVVLILPGLLLGFSRNIELLVSWFNMLVAPFAREGYAALEIANQSLYAVLMRVLSNLGWLNLEHMPAEQLMRVGMEEMSRPATALGRLLRPAISVAGLAAIAWACRGRGVGRRDPRLLLQVSLVLVLMLLMGERTWKHHATTLPIVFLSVWYALTCFDWPARFRTFMAAGLGVQFFLTTLSGEGVFGDRLADHMLDGGLFCWGLVLCAVQIAWMLSRWRQPAI
jgi:hypothetical protein